ncbi:MAG: sugar phosphate isomerase/epimerase family protein [Planctomycetota bacterium]
MRLESLGLPIRKAVEFAARIGAQGVQFDAVGELAPEQLSQTGRRQLKHILSNHGLSIIGIGFPTRRGFDHLEQLEARQAAALRMLPFAHELGAPIVIGTPGKIPDKADDPKSRHFFDALERIGREAERVGTRFALETGWDSPERMVQFFNDMKCFGLAVNYDPGNLLVRGFDIYGGVPLLGDRIVGVHVKDVLRSATTVSGYLETRMGDGELDWNRFFGAMAEIDYPGYFTVERETSNDPLSDVTQAVEFLKRF